MPWQPLPRIAFAVATYPFAAESPADLPLEIGDELYIIEETPDGAWLRGYLGQTLEARVFSGIFPRSCVEVREMLGGADDRDDTVDDEYEDERGEEPISDTTGSAENRPASDSAKSELHQRAFAHEADSPREDDEPPQQRQEEARDPNAPRPAAPVPMLKIGDETPTSAAEPLIDEIASCLREWHSKYLHELLLSRKYAELDQLSQLIARLNLHRQQFLYNVLTTHEYERLREQTVWDLVKLNKLCGGEVIVRDPAARGRVLTGDDSVVDVTRLQSQMSLLDEPPQPAVELSSLHHILLDVKGFAGSSNEETTLVLYLASKPRHGSMSILSECFSVDIPAGGAIEGLTLGSSTRTLFTDLSAQDIGDAPAAESELYLVVKVLALQRVFSPQPISRTGTGGEFSRPGESSKAAPATAKSSRRSLMWGSKSGRPTFSRGNGVSRTDSVSERQGSSYRATTAESRDGYAPPSTAGSRAVAFTEPAYTAQRTVGVGVLKLNDLLKHDDEIEQLIGISGAERPAWT
ncbi:hypothetical protein ACCO45_005365 [Purpureocillium lilacinum]|uniref:Uncharacterized protein n=1 Tax=Purpureocillium lilacinum TaxID=33203 RepID=A0ACC4DYA6_PURLI